MSAVSMIHGCIGNDLTSGQPWAITASADEASVWMWTEGCYDNLSKCTNLTLKMTK